MALARANPGDSRFLDCLFEIALALAVVVLDTVGGFCHRIKWRKCFKKPVLTFVLMAKKKAQVRVDGGVTVSAGDRSLSIKDGALTVTNEYGNSAEYRIEDHSFESLWSQLWQFVKDSQH